MSTNSTIDVSESEKMLGKMLIAGSKKNFTDPKHRPFVSKLEIKRMNICEMAGYVMDFAEKSSDLYLSSAYSLGLCRLYKEQLSILEADLIKFDKELYAELCNTKSKFTNDNTLPKKEKKRSNKEVDDFDLASEASSQRCEESNFIDLFQQTTEGDPHLLNEIDIRFIPVDTLGDFGDEIHLDESIRVGPQEWSPEEDEEMKRLSQGIRENHQRFETTTRELTSTPGQSAPQQGRIIEARSINSTPKRRNSRDPHDETPKKRQKTSSQAEAETNGKSSASRRLFGSEETSSSSRISAVRNVPSDEHFGGDLPEEPMPLQSLVEEIPNIHRTSEQLLEEHFIPEPEENFNPIPEGAQPLPFIEGARESSPQMNQISPEQEPEQEQNRELEQPTAEVPQNAPNHAHEYHENSNDLNLEELNDESLALTPRRNRRSRQVFDEEKQIKIGIDRAKAYSDETYLKKCSKMYTRALTLANPEKKSLPTLFSLPATGRKLNGALSWGKTLQNLWFERARPIIGVNHDETAASPQLPRDAFVNQRGRFSSFGRDSRRGQSVPSVVISQNATTENVEENIIDPDRELMPPPRVTLTPSRMHNQNAELPVLSPQSSLHQLPGTPNRSIGPNTSAVSPRQPPPFNNITEHIPADEPPPVEAELPDDPDRRFDSPDRRDHHALMMSPRSSASDRERSLLMDEYAFYRFLERLWSTDETLIIELRQIIPRGSNYLAFFRYFSFLQSFQRNRQLRMEQEVIYGRVDIIKEIENREDVDSS